MKDPKEEALKILMGFVNDPPDSEFQWGYLGAMLTFSNEVLCIPNDDPTWKAADAVMEGKLPEPPKPRWTPRVVS